MQVRILLPTVTWNSKMVMQWIRGPSEKEEILQISQTKALQEHSACKGYTISTGKFDFCFVSKTKKVLI